MITLTLLSGAESIFASLLADIESARTVIFLEFYIIAPQGAGCGAAKGADRCCRARCANSSVG